MENTYNKPITSAKHTFLIIEPSSCHVYILTVYGLTFTSRK
jgi:hypothetical protein